MFGSPGFSKPAHQYGQSFGDQAEVLDGEEPASGAVIPAGQLSVGDRVRIHVSGTLEPLVVRDEEGNPVWEGVTGVSAEEWAGRGFSEPVDGGVDLSPLAVLGGMEPGEVPDLGMEQADGEFGGQWVGKGFDKLVQDPE